MQIKGGISAFIAPRPRIVLISSAGTERNARIGNDEAARKKDIPIVQLNPGGVLNYKYDGETSVRSSGLAYTVLRPTGEVCTPRSPTSAMPKACACIVKMFAYCSIILQAVAVFLQHACHCKCEVTHPM